MIERLSKMCGRLIKGRARLAEIDDLGRSLRALYVQMKTTMEMPAQWIKPIDGAVVARVETMMSLVSSTVDGAGKIMGAADDAFREATAEATTVALLQKLGQDTRQHEDAIDDHLTSIGLRLQEVELMGDIMREHYKAIDAMLFIR